MLLYSTVSTLKPIAAHASKARRPNRVKRVPESRANSRVLLGIVVTTSPHRSWYRIVVLPAPSNPRIKIRTYKLCRSRSLSSSLVSQRVATQRVAASRAPHAKQRRSAGAHDNDGRLRPRNATSCFVAVAYFCAFARRAPRARSPAVGFTTGHAKQNAPLLAAKSCAARTRSVDLLDDTKRKTKYSNANTHDGIIIV